MVLGAYLYQGDGSVFQRDGSVFHDFVRVSGMCFSVARYAKKVKGKELAEKTNPAHWSIGWLCRNTVVKGIN